MLSLAQTSASSTSWRMLNAVVFVWAYHWEISVRPYTDHYLSLWFWALHAGFFVISALVPVRLFVSVLHGMAYTASFVVLFCHILFLVLKPDLDFANLYDWGFTPSSKVVLRSFLFHGWPVIAHYIDVKLSINQLASIYKQRGWRVWALIGFAPLILINEHFNHPSDRETALIKSVSLATLSWLSKAVSVVAAIVGTSILFHHTKGWHSQPGQGA